MFLSLHTHTCKGSIRDAIATPEVIIKKIKSMSQNAIGITDHGSTSALMTMYKLCKKNNIKLIMGIEAYITDSVLIKERNDYRHICL